MAPQGVMGGLGIFTKAAVKLYPYFGPPEPELEGVSPSYRFKKMPENFEIHHPVFPDWDKLIEAGVKIGESEVAMMVFRLPLPMLAEAFTGTGAEAEVLLQQMQEESDGRPGFLVIIAGATAAEFDYRKRVLAQILGETDAVLLSHIEKPDVKSEILWSETRFSGGVREGFRATGRFHGLIGDSAMFQTSTRFMLDCMGLKRDLPSQGQCQGRRWSRLRHRNGFRERTHRPRGAARHDAPDGSWVERPDGILRQCEDLGIRRGYTAPVTVWGDRAHDKWGPHLGNYHLWLRQIKKAFDPNGVSEPAMYISAKE